MNRDDHRAEMERRARRRAERSARRVEHGPTPHNLGPRKTTSDVDKITKAHSKRRRRALRRFEEAQRTKEGQHGG